MQDNQHEEVIMVTFDNIEVKELRAENLGLAATPIAMRASASQAALSGIVSGAFGCDSEAHFLEIYNMVVEMRASLMALGLWKGSA